MNLNTVADVPSFSSITPAVRVHAGPGALEKLPRELDRLDARRAFVICGNSVATRTPLLARVRDILETRYAGAYTRLGKDAPVGDVQEAARLAREVGADALIAIGAGSVLKAVRVVAILMAEDGAPETLATQYPEGRPPISPRLHAPKPPIFNVVTAATSAQNRGGAALKNPGGPRLEYFDPKTRPTAIFWDAEALLTAPPSLALSTGVGVYWRALMNAGAIRRANPLVQASRLHAYTLARDALPRMTDPGDAQARIDMCAAALLQNRDEDDGGRPFDAHWIARSVYALGAALFNQAAHLDQGTTHALLTAPALRHFGDLCPDNVKELAVALGLDPQQDTGPADAVADAVHQLFAGLGLPMRLRELDVTPELFPTALEHSLQNFNADRAREMVKHRARLEALLHDAY